MRSSQRTVTMLWSSAMAKGSPDGCPAYRLLSRGRRSVRWFWQCRCDTVGTTCGGGNGQDGHTLRGGKRADGGQTPPAAHSADLAGTCDYRLDRRLARLGH